MNKFRDFSDHREGVPIRLFVASGVRFLTFLFAVGIAIVPGGQSWSQNETAAEVSDLGKKTLPLILEESSLDVRLPGIRPEIESDRFENLADSLAEIILDERPSDFSPLSALPPSPGLRPSLDTGDYQISNIQAEARFAPSIPTPSYPNQTCQAALARYNVRWEPAPYRSESKGCSLVGGVRLHAINGIAINDPVDVNCEVAARFSHWVDQVLQPLVAQYLGARVGEIEQWSGYRCTYRSGGRLSEHAFGNAIDFRGFSTMDGRSYNVEDSYYGRHSSLFKALARGACRGFKLVLSPASNADHADHLHFDMGKWSACEI